MKWRLLDASHFGTLLTHKQCGQFLQSCALPPLAADSAETRPAALLTAGLATLLGAEAEELCALAQQMVIVTLHQACPRIHPLAV